MSNKEETICRFRSQSVLRALTLILDLRMDNLLHGLPRLIDCIKLAGCSTGTYLPVPPNPRDGVWLEKTLDLGLGITGVHYRIA